MTSTEPTLHPLWELTKARLLEFWREKGAVFWVFGFPILMAIGLGLAVAVAHPLALFLAEGIKPLDAVTFGSVILICLSAGGIAALMPAQRALSIDPMSTLRVE